MNQTAEFRIVAGADYCYEADWPAGCKGHLYRVHRFIIDVPTYTEKVLVECLTGRDRGLWFTVSPANFAMRYLPIQASLPARAKDTVVLIPERVAGYPDTEGDKLKGLKL